MPSSIEYVRAGKLRALAVTTATRSKALLDIPTVGEFVPGYEASGWFGIGAPKNTQAEIVDRLNKEINTALADPGMKARIAWATCSRSRPPTLENSSPTIPRSGAR
jgi:tripartite-type tricarboxylate transporter receptor subunit TctC